MGRDPSSTIHRREGPEQTVYRPRTYNCIDCFGILANAGVNAIFTKVDCYNTHHTTNDKSF